MSQLSLGRLHSVGQACTGGRRSIQGRACSSCEATRINRSSRPTAVVGLLPVKWQRDCRLPGRVEERSEEHLPLNFGFQVRDPVSNRHHRFEGSGWLPERRGEQQIEGR